MLIQLYIFSLVLSAVLLVASLLVANVSDTAADREASASPSDPSEIGQLDGVEPSPRQFFLTTAKSVRFWTFFVAFFGMTGLVLDGLDVMAPAVALLVAIVTGVLVAAAINAAIRIFSA